LNTFSGTTVYRPLTRSVYNTSAEAVASLLLGQLLIRTSSEGTCGGIIVETEAYLTDDPACHAYRGPSTRNQVMFGEPGHAYVYFIYGCHFCLNAVCRPAGVAEAVLIRALEPVFGQAMMQKNRRCPNPRQLTNGPGKLCQAMKIDRSLDGVDFCDSAGPLYIAENPGYAEFMKTRKPIVISPRIGITKAVSHPLRFFLAGSSYVSGRNGAAKGKIE
jgi:DNA-3-methyladenine glycosylase